MVKKSQSSKIEAIFSYIESGRPNFGRCVVIRVKNLLTVVIRETTPKTTHAGRFRRPLISPRPQLSLRWLFHHSKEETPRIIHI